MVAVVDDEFRGRMLDAVKEFSEDTKFDEDVWRGFAEGLYYVSGDLNDDALYGRVAAKLGEIETAHHTGGNILFYLSIQEILALLTMRRHTGTVVVAERRLADQRDWAATRQQASIGFTHDRRTRGT